MTALRMGLARLLVVLAVLVLPVALASAWTAGVAGDTGRYVDAVGPLAQDTAVQQAVEDRVTDAGLRAIGNDSVATAVEGALRQAVVTVVESTQFPPVWRAANRGTHQQLVAALEDDSGAVGADGTVSIDLATVLDPVFAALAEQGIVVPASIPDVQASFALLDSSQLAEARQGYQLLNALGFWLPALWVALVVLALLLSPRRRKTLGLVGWGSALGGLALLGGLPLARTAIIDRARPDDADLVGAVWDVVTHSLHTWALVALVAGLVLGALMLALRWAGRGRRSGYSAT